MQNLLTKRSLKGQADYAINQFIGDRWSPRSLLDDAIPEKDLSVLFEAAQAEPYSYNNQPWRTLHARRSSEHWSLFLNSLKENVEK